MGMSEGSVGRGFAGRVRRSTRTDHPPPPRTKHPRHEFCGLLRRAIRITRHPCAPSEHSSSPRVRIRATLLTYVDITHAYQTSATSCAAVGFPLSLRERRHRLSSPPATSSPHPSPLRSLPARYGAAFGRKERARAIPSACPMSPGAVAPDRRSRVSAGRVVGAARAAKRSPVRDVVVPSAAAPVRAPWTHAATRPRCAGASARSDP